MNPFDDAVIDLLASAPEPTPLERLRARVRRRRRRRAIAIVSITAVVSAGSIGVAASLGRDMPAGQLTKALAAEALERMRALAASKT